MEGESNLQGVGSVTETFRGLQDQGSLTDTYHIGKLETPYGQSDWSVGSGSSQLYVGHLTEILPKGQVPTDRKQKLSFLFM